MCLWPGAKGREPEVARDRDCTRSQELPAEGEGQRPNQGLQGAADSQCSPQRHLPGLRSLTFKAELSEPPWVITSDRPGVLIPGPRSRTSAPRAGHYSF